MESDEDEIRQIKVERTFGSVPITEVAWEQLLRNYRLVYRGPRAEEELREQLQGFEVLTKTGKAAPGTFIRYMRRGVIDTDLRRGGFVDKCNSKTIQVQDGRRRWRVSRQDNYIFVKVSDDAPTGPKRRNRILLEEILRADDLKRSQRVD
jgi:hypothetical protein